MRNILLILMLVSNLITPILVCELFICELFNVKDSLCSLISLCLTMIHLVPTYKVFIKLF